VLSFSNNNERLEKNKAIYVKTNFHITFPITKRVKRQLNRPNVQYTKKELSNSTKHHISNCKRKNL